jgi:hypothetical protein
LRVKPLIATAIPLAMRLGDSIVAMEWAIGTFFAVMLGLYIWSHITAGHAMGKKVQPFIDDLFGVGSKTGQNPADKDHR